MPNLVLKRAYPHFVCWPLYQITKLDYGTFNFELYTQM